MHVAITGDMHTIYYCIPLLCLPLWLLLQLNGIPTGYTTPFEIELDFREKKQKQKTDLSYPVAFEVNC